jgi:hypothetical protein
MIETINQIWNKENLTVLNLHAAARAILLEDG